jgi:hypothetical protein
MIIFSRKCCIVTAVPAVPICFCYLQIAGNIPDRIGLLAALESLNLASNQFTGRPRG